MRQRLSRSQRRERIVARLCVLPGATWLILFFAVPLGVLFAVSVATTDILNFPVFGFHVSNYRDVLQTAFIPVIIRSLAYAGLTALVCLLLGYPTAYVVARYGGRHRNAIILLVVLPWLVDYLIRIYAWLEIVGSNGLASGALQHLGLAGRNGIDLIGHSYTVVGSLVYSFLPIMILACYVSIEQLDGQLLEASKDLFGSPSETFFHITLPLTLPGVMAGIVLVFLPAVGDFATASLLGGPDQVMVGNLINVELQAEGGLPTGAGLTVLLIVVLIVLVTLYLILLRLRRSTAGANRPLVGEANPALSA
jgi:spermidine/putrescine transport system permease protein